MAAGCCSSSPSASDGGGNGATTLTSPMADAQQHDHHHEAGHEAGHDDHGCTNEPVCPDNGDCCDDDACDDVVTDTDDSRSPTLACCDSNQELCDEKCIIAFAALECEKTCDGDVNSQDGSPSHEHDHDEQGHHPTSACSTHLAKAFDQYAAYLESARCICRGILERGWSTSCCGDEAQNAASKVSSKNIDKRDTAYSTGHKTKSHHHHRSGVKHRGNKTSKNGNVSQVYHDSTKPDDASCCSGHQTQHASLDEKPRISTPPVVDVEKAEGLQQVVLAVDGMTCSGCGAKMEKTLKAAAGVSAVRVNFVMGHAEFSLDTTVHTPDEVIRGVERATGFHCTLLASDDQALDLLAEGHAAKELLDIDIPGVTQVSLLNKKTVRVSYDPVVIGGRTLVEKLKPLSQGLAPPRDDPSISSGRKRLYDQLFKTIAAAAFTIPVIVLAWGGNLVDEKTRAYVSIVLATIVQLIAVPDFYRPAISALVHSGSVEMDMLVVISITAAYFYSIVAFSFRMVGKPLETSEFFETSTLLITLVLLGRLVATFARIRAVEAVSLRSLQSSTAVIVENGNDSEVDARLLQYGDKLKIGPHTAIPTDATVVGGSSEVDESMLTGESAPVFKKEGDAVIAGTINGSGTLLARLTRLPGKNTVTDIAQLVEEASNSKPKLQDVADRIAGWFVPIVGSVALVVIVVWVVVGLKGRGYGVGKAISNAITYAVATLAVSCPCALGLAVPMVLVVAGGIAAKNGVIIKSAECTERARKVTDVVLDKTGTVTKGELDVMVEEFFDMDRDESIAISKALVSGNKHPVSVAVAKHLNQYLVGEAVLENAHVIPGAGVEATMHGAVIRAGNPQWTDVESHPSVSRLQESGMTILAISRNSKLLAVYGLRTSIRDEAARVIAQLGRRNIAVHLVSGDQKRAVESVAAEVGISHVASQCSPTEKRNYVASLMSEGKIVMFVGDGTNDAVAVAQADVGVQLASVLSASDVTRGAADVVLLAGLEGIPFLLEISAVSFRRMVFNFAWSGVYNVLAILLASGAFVNVRIPPAYAGLGEIVSVLPVVIAATTMLMSKIRVEG